MITNNIQANKSIKHACVQMEVESDTNHASVTFLGSHRHTQMAKAEVEMKTLIISSTVSLFSLGSVMLTHSVMVAYSALDDDSSPFFFLHDTINLTFQLVRPAI